VRALRQGLRRGPLDGPPRRGSGAPLRPFRRLQRLPARPAPRPRPPGGPHERGAAPLRPPGRGLGREQVPPARPQGAIGDRAGPRRPVARRRPAGGPPARPPGPGPAKGALRRRRCV
ncbi:MAG: hypothetical protein AVDCRST_MAG02-937, partial [uncultured Rubrobacteraceae bacterium]